MATAFRTAFADDRPCPTMQRAGQPEQRRAPDLGVVDPPVKPPERAARQQIPDTGAERPVEFVPQEPLDDLDQPFAHLERDVAGEPVAHDDLGLTTIQIAGLDVPDETQSATTQQLMRLADQLVALGLLLAGRQ